MYNNIEFTGQARDMPEISEQHEYTHDGGFQSKKTNFTHTIRVNLPKRCASVTNYSKRQIMVNIMANIRI